MYSARQLADKLGTALGKRLQVVDIPEAGQVEVMIQAGLPRPVAEVYAEMYRAIGSGLITSNGDRTVTGKPPSTTSYPTFSQTNKRKPLRNGAVLSRDERTGCAAAPRAAARRMSFPRASFSDACGSTLGSSFTAAIGKLSALVANSARRSKAVSRRDRH
jgi:hypothetical protein